MPAVFCMFKNKLFSFEKLNQSFLYLKMLLCDGLVNASFFKVEHCNNILFPNLSFPRTNQVTSLNGLRS